MARSRNIKPGFFTNDELAECQPIARLLFAGLWTIADREGRLEDRPKKIKAEVLPYDDCNVDVLLDELQQRGFILRYTAADRQYIQVLKFKEHQNPHLKEAPSTIPAPDLSSASAVPKPYEPGLNPLTDSLNLIPSTPLKPPRKRGGRSIDHPDFESWYQNYPHKVGRARASKAFHPARLKASLEDLDEGLRRYKASKPADRPWCNPATWLNEERWRDQPAEGTKLPTAAEIKSQQDAAALMAKFSGE